MASSSSKQYATVEVGVEEYPYPSNILSAASLISVKLSGRDKYGIWKTQMVCLLKSHDMFGFIDGTFVSPQTDVSGKEKVGDHYTHRLWARSDSLVKGWILGSLTDQTLMYVLNRLTEKFPQQSNSDFSAKDVWDELKAIYDTLLQTTYGPVGPPQQVQDTEQDKRRAGFQQLFYVSVLGGSEIDINFVLSTGEVAVLDKITNNGNTALHVAVGATKKADLLQKVLERTPENTQLLDLRNSDGSTLLHVAAIVGNTEAADILVGRNPDFLFAKDNEGHTPLAIALSNMRTQTAQRLLQHMDDDLEMGTLFSGTGGDDLLVTAISSKEFRLASDLLKRYKTLHSDAVLMAIALNFPRKLEGFSSTGTLHWKIESAVVTATDFTVDKCGGPYLEERVLTHLDATLLLRTIKDPSRNNILHLAARLAPSNKLNLISGAALQIQRELQWFKEVEAFVCPLNTVQKNSFNETPQMVFTREHKDLVIEGEKWMKATAESYTITAALIVTIVFAAAITVPGGNNGDTGVPIFTNNTAFTIFAISDAISLFAAVTSLLTFLSVLTARFAEPDFLFKLPTKLIIGLATLFISTTSMIVAFGATLYIVFGQRNSRILIPIAVLTCLPIISFVTLQFRLVIDLISATYGRSIFGKKRDDAF
ncbi:hypothetical protein L1887_38118 [Cichorium endivia]|nr:hypothetical protein L1887_38118 [Cichorium endivia]